MKSDKPIAIIAPIVHMGLSWAKENLEVREINYSHARIVDITGQEYYIISEMDHARGRQFSNLIVTQDSDSDVVEFVQNRIR